MRKNIYTDTVSEIKAPEKSVQAAISLIHSKDEKEKMIYMNKKVKFAGMIAASLAAVIAVGGAIGVLNHGKAENSFVLTANAAELNDRDFTQIKQFQKIGSSFSSEEEPGKIFSEEFDFAFKCEGKNIKKVDFTSLNSSFVYITKDFEGEDYTPIKGREQGDEFSSFTVDYEEDDTDVFNGALRLQCSINSNDAEVSEKVVKAAADLENHARTKMDMETDADYDDSEFDIQENTKTILDEIFSRMSVKLDITYKDGTTQTRSVIFRCDDVTVDGMSTVSAKIE